MRDWFIKDFGWKLFSVFLALAIWLTVHKILDEGMGSPAVLIRGVERTCDDLPVLIVSSAADVRDFHVKPAAVAVTVSGSSDDIARLQPDQIRVFVDLTGIDTGNLHRRVDVSMPSGLKLVSVEPSEVDVVVPPPHHQTP